MKTRNISIMVFIVLCISCATKKVYTPKHISSPPRYDFLKNEKVSVAVFDGRLDAENSYELKNSIITTIKQSYPSADLQILNESQYYSDAKPNQIMIKIAIAAYSAGFGSKVLVGKGSVGGSLSYLAIPKGKWNGLSSFSINIFDYRNQNDKKHNKDIVKLISKPNTWGYKTAKAALNESYEAAIQELLFFIDNSLIK